MKKIAVLYIATGNYDIFWPEFYSSCEKFFCSNYEKHYFVFTDSLEIKSTKNVNKVYQDNLGWPFNTLYRYRMFLRIKPQLVNYDYIVFVNANAKFIQPISVQEFFGDNCDYVAAIHPGYFNKSTKELPFEKRTISLANTPAGINYYQGAINAGKAAAIIRLFETLVNNIELDLTNGVMALWHDESHWNAYFNNNLNLIQDRINVLSPAYIYPENWQIPFQPIILLRDKNKYGGHNILRGVKTEAKQSLWNRIYHKIIRICRCK